jgi:uncharacterized membrane protein YcaP (DUF421 family)
MDTVIRALVVYLFLLLIFRVAGKRSLGQITTFDLVLTLIISEAIQQALIDTDDSLTNALLLVTTLVALNIALSFLKQRFRHLDKWLEGRPLVLIQKGRMHHDRMRKERVDETTIMQVGRNLHGLRRMDDIAYAVVEQEGHISVIPRRDDDRDER